MIDVMSFAAGVAVAAVPAGVLLHQMWRALARLRYAATHDGLTGLLNRSAFKAQAGRLVADPERSCAVAIVDVDRLKQINDTPGLGHAAGDAVLVAVAARMAEVVAGQGLVARLGGDEFAVAVAAPDATQVWRVDELFERLAERIRQPVTVRTGVRVQVTASVGVAPAYAMVPLSDLLRWADTAMYQAKRNGQGLAVNLSGVVDVDQPAGGQPQVPDRRPWRPAWGGLR